MMPLLLGSFVLVVSGMTTASKCVTARAGVDPWLAAPVVVVATVLAMCPIGLAIGGGVAVVAKWAWLIGAIASIPAGLVLHHAMVGVQLMAEIGGDRLNRISASDHPSIVELDRLDASLGNELERFVAQSPSLMERR